MKNCIHFTFSETFLVFLVSLVVFWGVKFAEQSKIVCNIANITHSMLNYTLCVKLHLCDKLHIAENCTICAEYIYKGDHVAFSMEKNSPHMKRWRG